MGIAWQTREVSEYLEPVRPDSTYGASIHDAVDVRRVATTQYSEILEWMSCVMRWSQYDEAMAGSATITLSSTLV